MDDIRKPLKHHAKIIFRYADMLITVYMRLITLATPLNLDDTRLGKRSNFSSQQF